VLKVGTLTGVSNQDVLCSNYAKIDLYEFTGDILEGVFSWESVWPEFGPTNVGDASKDVTAMAAASGFPPFFHTLQLTWSPFSRL
jgi:hypothetical protein